MLERINRKLLNECGCVVLSDAMFTLAYRDRDTDEKLPLSLSLHTLDVEIAAPLRTISSFNVI